MPIHASAPNPIRVLLADMPSGLLTEIVTELASSQANLELVASDINRQDLKNAVMVNDADVVILGLEDSEIPRPCLEVHGDCSSVLLVGLTADGMQTAVHIHNIGTKELVDAIQTLSRQPKRRLAEEHNDGREGREINGD